jgi:hypothetical protein
MIAKSLPNLLWQRLHSSVISIQSISLFFYLLVQYNLVSRLSPAAYGLFIASNALALFCGQLAAAGIDGKIMSNTFHPNKDLDIRLILSPIFEYIPFAATAAIFFLIIRLIPGSPLQYLEACRVSSLFIVLTAFLQPLLSINLVLADRDKKTTISNVILVGPWLFRSILLVVVPFLLNIYNQYTISVEYVMLSYLISGILVIIYSFRLFSVRYSQVLGFLAHQALIAIGSPPRIFMSIWRNKIYFLSSIMIMAPISIAPTILNNSPGNPSALSAFSFAYITLGVIQSIGSQYLVRNFSLRLLKDSQILPLPKLLRKTLNYARFTFCAYLACFLLLFGYCLLAYVHFVPSFNTQALILLLILMIGLFPSGLITLWHILFNMAQYQHIHFASRALTFFVTIPMMLWATYSWNAIGLSITLSVYPLVALFSYVLFSLIFSGSTSGSSLAR